MVLKKNLFSLSLLFFTLITITTSFAQTEECLVCHEDKSFSYERDNKLVSLHVNGNEFKSSTHGDFECVDCHIDFDPENIPHREGEQIYKVDCAMCHDEPAENFYNSLHGQALQQGKYLAPECHTCHTKHNILPASNEKSSTYVMNIPELCGQCHKEGTQVSNLRSISQRHILENYAESIHGDGLFKRGLIVTAVCTSCHYSHNILPHEHPESSINRNNIAETCMQCHSQIETVHKKVIRGELWEKEPHKIPACVDCHEPHKVRRVYYEQQFNNDLCMSCHSNPDIQKVENGEVINLHVDISHLENSVHSEQECIKCHTNVSSANNPVCLNSGPVDCSVCHAEQVDEWQLSKHSMELVSGNDDAPYCTDCHGEHNMLSKENRLSPTFARNVPELCGRCHVEGGVAKSSAMREEGIYQDYSMSIHGSLLTSGLTVTATCINCHTAHRELPEENPLSSIHPDNVGETCAECHLGIYEQFRNSIHSPLVADTDKELPGCQDCHKAHTIQRTDQPTFREEIINQCGRCHEDVTDTYFDTFHGKVSKLGAVGAAKCYDCHGSHNILPTYMPGSTLHRDNIVETCATCHENSNRKFVGYLTHATHHDKDKYPFLYYTFWFMTILLTGTFLFFGLHTLLWLPRGLAERRNEKKIKEKRE